MSPWQICLDCHGTRLGVYLVLFFAGASINTRPNRYRKNIEYRRFILSIDILFCGRGGAGRRSATPCGRLVDNGVRPPGGKIDQDPGIEAALFRRYQPIPKTGQTVLRVQSRTHAVRQHSETEEMTVTATMTNNTKMAYSMKI